MTDGSRRTRAEARVQILIDDPAWRRLMKNPDIVVRRAAEAACGNATIVLASDRVVRLLNAQHRGINKSTNVLTFDAPGPGQPGEIVLAAGVVRREAAQAGKRAAHHLAHLVIHGALHLQGHDHHAAGEARRMEQTESALMGRLRMPNPWKRT
jgi:probable rRNA maturation factor